eukprot:12104045-Ditylum_brightwellii.AAC.1
MDTGSPILFVHVNHWTEEALSFLLMASHYLQWIHRVVQMQLHGAIKLRILERCRAGWLGYKITQ